MATGTPKKSASKRKKSAGKPKASEFQGLFFARVPREDIEPFGEEFRAQATRLAVDAVARHRKGHSVIAFGTMILIVSCWVNTLD